MSENVVSLDKHRPPADLIENVYQCECGSFTFHLIFPDGVVCTDCDGYHPKLEVTFNGD